MNLACRLLLNGFYKTSVVVPEAVYSYSGYEIDVFTSVCTVQRCIFSFYECEVETSVVIYNFLLHKKSFPVQKIIRAETLILSELRIVFGICVVAKVMYPARDIL